MKLFGLQTGKWVNKVLNIDEPYYHYSSREEYYRSLFREGDLKSLYNLLDKNLIIPTLTNATIKFRDIEFGTALADVLENLGSPRYIINNKELGDTHQVLFYKFTLGGYRAIAQLHFLHNFFFYASYTFKELNNASLQKIEEVLSTRYFSGLERNGLSSQVVADADNNRIFIKKGLYLSVKFVSGNRKFHDDVLQLMRSKERKRQKMEKQHRKSWQVSQQ